MTTAIPRRVMRPTLARAVELVPQAAPAAVMATGIVSLALRSEGWIFGSEATMWIAVALWATLVPLVCAHLLRHPGSVTQPAVLTAPAGTCVLGSRVTAFGWHWAGAALLVAGTIQWLVLLPPVLRAWNAPTTGAGFLTTVSTAALAVLALALRSEWLRTPASVVVALAALLYVLTVARFDLRELAAGGGDQWVAGGALAILALALAPLDGALALAAWIGASAWGVVLVATELRRPRLRFDVRRWATVFPLGMYSVASTAVARAAHAHGLTAVGHVFGWIALAAWAATLLGAAARTGELL